MKRGVCDVVLQIVARSEPSNTIGGCRVVGVCTSLEVVAVDAASKPGFLSGIPVGVSSSLLDSHTMGSMLLRDIVLRV